MQEKMEDESKSVLTGEIPGGALSFSKISTFTRCQYQFYLSYVKKIRTAPSAAMILGRAFHSGQQYGVTEMIERSTPPPDMVTDYAVAYYEATLILEPDTEFGGDDPNAGVVKDDLVKMSGPVFDKSVSKLNPITCEEKFEIEVSGVRVRGRLDIKDKKEDGVSITELKTGTRRPELLTSFDLQTSIYSKSQNNVRGLRKIFTVRHLDKNRNFSVLNYIKKPDPPSFINDMILMVGRVAEAIKSASIYGFIKQSDLRTCSWCGHRKMCRPEIFANEHSPEEYVSLETVFSTKPEKKIKI